MWAVEGGCDYFIAETFSYLGEALLALEVITQHAKGTFEYNLTICSLNNSPL